MIAGRSLRSAPSIRAPEMIVEPDGQLVLSEQLLPSELEAIASGNGGRPRVPAGMGS